MYYFSLLPSLEVGLNQRDSISVLTKFDIMSVTDSIQSIASSLLAQKSLSLVSWQPIQALWAGYGHICRVFASPSPSPSGLILADLSTCPAISVSPSTPSTSTSLQSQPWILKYIAPPSKTKTGDEGHVRKLLSYHVEQYFYTDLANQMPANIPVATCLASIKAKSASSSNGGGENVTAMLLTDLRLGFPVAGEKLAELNEVQIHAALDWLADFHGFWWTRMVDFNRDHLVRPPLEEVQRERKDAEGSVWLNGGYTYLATRRKEYASLADDEDSEWSEALCSTIKDKLSVAEKVAKVLSSRSDGLGILSEYETLIHGDVKSANLFTTQSGRQVAFYDFQYVGLGLGVCDLAKLFTCSMPLWMLIENDSIPDTLGMQEGEKRLLRRYQKTIEKRSGREYPWEELLMHWETALVDWLRFQASWGFWGNTEWLEARVRYILDDPLWKNWLDSNAG